MKSGYDHVDLVLCALSVRDEIVEGLQRAGRDEADIERIKASEVILTKALRIADRRFRQGRPPGVVQGDQVEREEGGT
ncbi:hypothetical protein EP7_004256 [Isosphaeraceae bacterium EP7]